MMDQRSFSDDSFEIVEYSSCEENGNKDCILTEEKVNTENLTPSSLSDKSSPDQVEVTKDVTYTEDGKDLIHRKPGLENCGHVLCTCDNTQDIPVFQPASLPSVVKSKQDSEVQDGDTCVCSSRLTDGPQSGLILDVNYLTKQKPTCVQCSPDLSSSRKLVSSSSGLAPSVEKSTNGKSHSTDSHASHSSLNVSHSTESTTSQEYRTCNDTDGVRQQSDQYIDDNKLEQLHVSDPYAKVVKSNHQTGLCQININDCQNSETDQPQSNSETDQPQSNSETDHSNEPNKQDEEKTGNDLQLNKCESKNGVKSKRKDLHLDIGRKSLIHGESNEGASGDSPSPGPSVPSPGHGPSITDSLPTPVCRRGTPMSKEDLGELLDKDGRLVDEHALRKAVFMGGVDPSVRKQVWQFLFGLYPCSSTTREREVLLLDYIMKYHEQISRWKTMLMLNAKPGASLLQQGLVARYQIEDSNNELRSPEDMLEDPISEYEMLEKNMMAGKMRSGKPDFNSLSKNFHAIDISSPEMQQKMDFMKIQAQVYVNRQKIDVKSLWSHIRVIDKDVPRTDRDLDYFKGAMNPTLTVLRNILITFSAFNSDIGYAQGMNDILAQFLVVFDSEVEAYWCFSNYMKKIQREFTEDGMVNKISLVALLLQEMDPALYEHLKANDLGDLLFCHRWLLLGFKREFKFMDSLRCFEILSSHHLELTSMEADKARRHELQKEFEHLRGVQRSTAPTDTDTEYTFELFMCIALLQKARSDLMECTDTAMVFSIINQLEINLDDILLKSAELFYFYCKKTVEDSFLLVDAPKPQGLKPNYKR